MPPRHPSYARLKHFHACNVPAISVTALCALSSKCAPAGDLTKSEADESKQAQVHHLGWLEWPDHPWAHDPPAGAPGLWQKHLAQCSCWQAAPQRSAGTHHSTSASCLIESSSVLCMLLTVHLLLFSPAELHSSCCNMSHLSTYNLELYRKERL